MASQHKKSEETSVQPYANYLRQILESGLMEGKVPVVTTNPNLLEQQAEATMIKKGFNYIKGAAGEGATLRANRSAFEQWQIIPRVLIPTTPRDLSVTLFGQMYATPLLMAPVGAQSWYHRDKEIGTARACASLSVPFTLSTASSTGIEELVEAVPEGPKWFQLYWPQDNDITISILKRARASGFQALVVTLDTWSLGWRPNDLDPAAVPFLVGEGDEVGFQDPVFRQRFAQESGGKKPEDDKVAAGVYWCSQVLPGVSRSWDDIKMLRKHWDLPIILKGVLSIEDAKLAVQHGVDGIIVSTHGGRQLDGAVGALDMLPRIAKAVGDKITVMMDSGVRTGADIVKALCLGAKAVFVARPIVYGLGIDGTAGAQAAMAGLLADLDLTMGFTGVKTISQLKRNVLLHASERARL